MCAPDANSGGTITGVHGATGLTGGGNAGSVVLSLAPAYGLPQSCADGQLPAYSATSKTWHCTTGVSFEPSVAQTDSPAPQGTPVIWVKPQVLVGAPPAFPTEFKVQNDSGFVAKGTLGIGAIPATGAGERVMWHPNKAAFRAGSIGSGGTEWDDANDGYYSTAFGYNTTARGHSSIAEGYQSRATGSFSTALGYSDFADGTGSVALGYKSGALGDYSVALGQRAYSGAGCPTTPGMPCNYDTQVANKYAGDFVFSDESDVTSFGVTSNNQFAARAAGGFRFRTKSDATTGCDLPASSGVFSCTSDRATKKDLKPVRAGNVLAKIMRLPLTTWAFKTEKAGVRHLGPMAQDFWKQFHLGTDNKSIGLTDLNGVTLAGIQALYQRSVRQQRQIRALQRQVAALTKSH